MFLTRAGLFVCRRGADQQALQGILDGYRAAKSKVVVYEWCEGGAAVYGGGEEEEEEEEEEEGEEGVVRRPEPPQFLADLWGGKMVEVSHSPWSLLRVLAIFDFFSRNMVYAFGPFKVRSAAASADKSCGFTGTCGC
jgi:hypothetical protein